MFAIFSQFVIETHKSTECNVCLRVCVKELSVRANVLYVSVCLFFGMRLWVFVSLCMSVWMYIPANVTFLVCLFVFCLNQIVCFVGMSVSSWVFRVQFEFSACFTACLSECLWGRANIFPCVSIYTGGSRNYTCVWLSNSHEHVKVIANYSLGNLKF